MGRKQTLERKSKRFLKEEAARDEIFMRVVESANFALAGKTDVEDSYTEAARLVQQAVYYLDIKDYENLQSICKRLLRFSTDIEFSIGTDVDPDKETFNVNWGALTRAENLTVAFNLYLREWFDLVKLRVCHFCGLLFVIPARQPRAKYHNNICRVSNQRHPQEAWVARQRKHKT